jgi:hypothetical protein
MLWGGADVPGTTDPPTIVSENPTVGSDAMTSSSSDSVSWSFLSGSFFPAVFLSDADRLSALVAGGGFFGNDPVDDLLCCTPPSFRLSK